MPDGVLGFADPLPFEEGGTPRCSSPPTRLTNGVPARGRERTTAWRDQPSHSRHDGDIAALATGRWMRTSIACA
jgi:hypothetical protein